MSIYDQPIIKAIRAAWPGAEITYQRGTALTDANEAELAAMVVASDRAGEFIETTGKTDMAQWSQAQWHQFIEVVCGGYVDGLMAQEAALKTAIAKVRT